MRDLRGRLDGRDPKNYHQEKTWKAARQVNVCAMDRRLCGSNTKSSRPGSQTVQVTHGPIKMVAVRQNLRIGSRVHNRRGVQVRDASGDDETITKVNQADYDCIATQQHHV
ncbi:uncharacterized protein SCHCODRAFT_02345190 [Schizophyllum commune H4-8]|uniref:uncharacterized protein n=1 Tax=Schizophyllum commune (strain H4-8 / FGSC 9210) TaxID=578458 RepID=UPI00215ED7D3|nr:uncharacterized protein SCHCODRAFT_02345190 [Schizophyllum commune H4-8]KAI5890441.1 hypothetical protein SCHCODRAFT_02345190 [Schizophyllum commune H4-8]